jgi:hypothetical protein
MDAVMGCSDWMNSEFWCIRTVDTIFADVCYIFRRVRKIAKSEYYFHHVRPSVPM